MSEYIWGVIRSVGRTIFYLILHFVSIIVAIFAGPNNYQKCIDAIDEGICKSHSDLKLLDR